MQSNAFLMLESGALIEVDGIRLIHVVCERAQSWTVNR